MIVRASRGSDDTKIPELALPPIQVLVILNEQAGIALLRQLLLHDFDKTNGRHRYKRPDSGRVY